MTATGVEELALSAPGGLDLDRARVALAAERFAEAAEAATDAVRMASETPSADQHVVVVRAHELISRVHLRDGDLVRAADAVVRASTAAIAAPPRQCRELLAVSGFAAAMVLSNIGDYENAFFELDRAMPQLAKGHPPADLADTLYAYGLVMHAAERPSQARVWLGSAERLARQHGLHRRLADVLVAEVSTWYGEGRQAALRYDRATAEALWQAGVSQADTGVSHLDPLPGSHRRHLAHIVRTRSLCLAGLGREQEAYTGLITAQNFAGETLAPHETIRLQHHAALVLQRCGELDQAWATVSSAIEQAQGLKGHNVEIELLELGARIAEQRGDAAGALTLYRRYHALHAAWTSDLWEAREHILLARNTTRRAMTRVEVDRRLNRAGPVKAVRANSEVRPTALPHHQGTTGPNPIPAPTLVLPPPQDPASVLEPTVVQRDSLTGLAGEEVLLAHLGDALDQARERAEPLSVAMVVIDHFDDIDTKFGPDVGDQVRRIVAAVVVDACRGDDMIARTDAAEFVAVFRNVPTMFSVKICERIRGAVEDFGWSKIAVGLEVTATVGMADVSNSDHPTKALARLTSMIRLATANGRNRVVAEPITPGVPAPRQPS